MAPPLNANPPLLIVTRWVSELPHLAGIDHGVQVSGRLVATGFAPDQHDQ
jgi:hypothetical protein